MKSFDYEILINENRETMFIKLDWIIEQFKKVDLDHYSIQYRSDIQGEIKEDDDVIFVLEDIYHTFNMNHPLDYKSRSLSVGDVVKLDDDYYIVDSMGFKKLTKETLKK